MDATGRLQLRYILLGDDPDAWSALGFAVRPGSDSQGAPVPASVRLANTTIGLTGSGTGFIGWEIEGVDRSLDGLPHSADPGCGTGDDRADGNPNGIDAIDHVVISTGDVPRSLAAFEAVGLQPRGGRSTTSYGSPMSQTFFWLGDVILELVGPDEGEPTTDDPGALFGLALVAHDLDATVSILGPLAGEPKGAVQAGRRIAGVRGRDVGVSIPLAVMSPHL